MCAREWLDIEPSFLCLDVRARDAKEKTAGRWPSGKRKPGTTSLSKYGGRM